MCPNLLNHCVDVTIDSEKKFKFTKYSGKKGNPKITKSDHHTILTKLNIQQTNRISERKEIFKLRDDSALNNFKQLTTNTNSLSNCFLQGQNIELSTNNWFKEMNNIVNKCFKKIRICEKPPKSTIEFQIYTRMIIIKKLKEILSTAAEMLKPVLNR